MLTILIGAFLGLIITGIIAIRARERAREKRKWTLVVTAELTIGLIIGLLVGFVASICLWPVLPKDYVITENINLMRMNNQEPKCFIAEVKWGKSKSSRYMFLKKDINEKQKFDMIPIAKIAGPYKKQREDGLIKVFENKSKIFHLFTFLPDVRCEIFIPEDSVVLTSK